MRRSIATIPATYPFQFTIRDPGFYWHNGNQIGAYVSDTYRVHPRWTLNLGLRWDFDDNLRDNELIDEMLADPRFRGMEQFVKSGKERGLQWDAFQPRFGATWDIRGDGTLVGRGGYGIVHHAEPGVVLGGFHPAGQSWQHRPHHRSDEAGAVLPVDQCILDGKTINEFLATTGSGLRNLALIDDNYVMPYQRTANRGHRLAGDQHDGPGCGLRPFAHAERVQRRGPESPSDRSPLRDEPAAGHDAGPRRDERACRRRRAGTTRWRCRSASA